MMVRPEMGAGDIKKRASSHELLVSGRKAIKAFLFSNNKCYLKNQSNFTLKQTSINLI